MRVHLRGVVIGVGVLLSVVLIVSLFNAFDSSSDDKSARSRHALSMDGEEQAGQSPRWRKIAPKARNRHDVHTSRLAQTQAPPTCIHILPPIKFDLGEVADDEVLFTYIYI